MEANIKVLALIQSLIFITQSLIIFVQYRIDKSNKGLCWWGQASLVIGIAVLLMPLVNTKTLYVLAIFANPLLVFGQISFYIGIIRFFNRKENRLFLVVFYIAFLISYNYFIFGSNSISARTIIVYSALAIISIMTAYELFAKTEKHISASANFTAGIFLSYGIFSVIRVLYTVNMPPIQDYEDQAAMFISFFIFSTILSTLWTFGFILMINQLLNVENLLEKEKMQLIFNTSPDAALITRLEDGLFIDVNDGFTAMTGYSREEVIGKKVDSINSWKDVADRNDFLKELKKTTGCENLEKVFLHKNGNLFLGTISGRIILINGIEHIVSTIHDITRHREAQEALIESEEKYRSILNASPDDITITDIEGRILIASPAANAMFGYDYGEETLVGMQILDLVLPEEVEAAKASLEEMYITSHLTTAEYHVLRKDGSVFNVEVNRAFINNSSGQPVQIVFIIRDITERKRTERKIQELVEQLELERNVARHNSITDSLTGLANRRFFDETFGLEFYHSKQSGSKLSLMMLDVDYFKKYNDTYGHVAGDDCLRQIGNVLKSIVRRGSDIVTRYGGEEFVIILPEIEDNDAKALAERIGKAVEALAIPHSDSDISKYVTVSIGVVLVSTVMVELPDQAVALVDKAMYRAKNSGRNRIEVLADYSELEAVI